MHLMDGFMIFDSRGLDTHHGTALAFLYIPATIHLADNLPTSSITIIKYDCVYYCNILTTGVVVVVLKKTQFLTVIIGTQAAKAVFLVYKN